MAQPKNSKKPAKKSTSLRQSIDSTASKKPKTRRLKKGASSVVTPTKRLIQKGKKEYNIPLPDNKTGRFLQKRGRFTPKYFRESWKQLKQVTWPDRPTTFRLTVAVLLFAIVFGLVIAIVDYGLDKIFRKLILE